MPLISLREFARKNGVSAMAISRAVKTGRLPHVNGKIDASEAQPVWDHIKDPVRAGRKLPCKLDQVYTPNRQVYTEVYTPSAGDPPSRSSQPEGITDFCQPARVDAPNCKLGEVYAPQPGVIFRQPEGSGRDISALAIQINGSEYKELATRAGEARLSLPAFVLSCCGETWRLDAAQHRPPPLSQGRPVRSALERRTVTIRVTKEMRDRLTAEARGACMILTQYIRKRCGFEPRTSSLPGTDQRYREEDDAWERLKRLGLNPKEYFD